MFQDCCKQLPADDVLWPHQHKQLYTNPYFIHMLPFIKFCLYVSLQICHALKYIWKLCYEWVEFVNYILKYLSATRAPVDYDDTEVGGAQYVTVIFFVRPSL